MRGKRSFPFMILMAEPTGLEPATSSVTGKRSNQLSYGSRYYYDYYKDLTIPRLRDTAPRTIFSMCH